MSSFKIDLKAPIQKIILNNDGTKLKAPFSMTISGPSQCGKSEFIFNLLTLFLLNRYRCMLHGSIFVIKTTANEGETTGVSLRPQSYITRTRIFGYNRSFSKN
jgi:hypothetical protein